MPRHSISISVIVSCPIIPLSQNGALYIQFPFLHPYSIPCEAMSESEKRLEMDSAVQEKNALDITTTVAVEHNGIRVHPQPTADPLDPLNWTRLQKHTILGIVMFKYDYSLSCITAPAKTHTDTSSSPTSQPQPCLHSPKSRPSSPSHIPR